MSYGDVEFEGSANDSWETILVCSCKDRIRF